VLPDGTVAWAEMRPSEGGRTVIAIRCGARAGTPARASPGGSGRGRGWPPWARVGRAGRAAGPNKGPRAAPSCSPWPAGPSAPPTNPHAPPTPAPAGCPTARSPTPRHRRPAGSTRARASTSTAAASTWRCRTAAWSSATSGVRRVQARGPVCLFTAPFLFIFFRGPADIALAADASARRRAARRKRDWATRAGRAATPLFRARAARRASAESACTLGVGRIHRSRSPSAPRGRPPPPTQRPASLPAAPPPAARRRAG
jgi:hypothetical protein